MNTWLAVKDMGIFPSPNFPQVINGINWLGEDIMFVMESKLIQGMQDKLQMGISSLNEGSTRYWLFSILFFFVFSFH